MPSASRPVQSLTSSLSRRERQIMDVVYGRGRATAAEVHAALPDPPCAAAVRTMLRILEGKGQLRHEKDGPRHIYLPTTPRPVAQRSALRHLLGTFFGGSRAAAVAALLDDSERPFTAAERAELEAVVRQLRQEGR
jgi:BlaI family transcriptional regulator, penicillinase repressor